MAAPHIARGHHFPHVCQSVYSVCMLYGLRATSLPLTKDYYYYYYYSVQH